MDQETQDHQFTEANAPGNRWNDRITFQLFAGIADAKGSIDNPEIWIIEIAEEENVDLIIIASSGKSGIDRFFLGSVAEKVIKNAKNDVLLINKF